MKYFGRISAGTLLVLGILSAFYGDFLASREYLVASIIISAIEHRNAV